MEPRSQAKGGKPITAIERRPDQFSFDCITCSLRSLCSPFLPITITSQKHFRNLIGSTVYGCPHHLIRR